MSTQTDDWNSILEDLAHGQIDQSYIDQKLHHLFQNTDLGYYIDNLGESLLFYAIIYQNKQLLSYITNNTNFASLSAKSKKAIKKSLFRAIKQLSYDTEKNSEFVEELIVEIANTSFRQLLTGISCYRFV